MNPKQNSVARFTNLSSETFTHPFGGVPHSFEPGESRLLPYPLAEHLARHLFRFMRLHADDSPTKYAKSDQPWNESGAPLWSESDEESAIGRILSEVYEEEKAKPKTEMELLNEKIEALNAFVRGVKTEDDDITIVENVPTNPIEPVVYKDKAEVIAELTKRQIAFDARKKKLDLEELLK